MEGADVLVFCVPHQFAHGVCRELRAVVKPGAVAISLTKVPCSLFVDMMDLICGQVRMMSKCDPEVGFTPDLAG